MQNKYSTKEGDLYFLTEGMAPLICDGCALEYETIDRCTRLKLLEVSVDELETDDCQLPKGFIIERIEVKKHERKKINI